MMRFVHNLALSQRQSLGVIFSALMVIVVVCPLIERGRDRIMEKNVMLQQGIEEKKIQIDDNRDQVAMLRGMREMPDDAEIEAVLAPVDLGAVGDLLEKQARYFYLSNFSYTFSPEQKYTHITALNNAAPLAHRVVTFEAEAMRDNDVYNFLATLHRRMVGRIRITHLVIERAGDSSSLHSRGELEWISNGVANKDVVR